MAAKKNVDLQETPKKECILVPPNHILMHERWRGSLAFRALVEYFSGAMTDDLKSIDFYCPASIAVIYVTEADFISGSNFEQRILQSTALSLDPIVISDRNTTTIEHFSKLQDLVVLDLGLTIIPIGNVMELPTVLSQLSFADSSRTTNNLFKRKCYKGQNELLINMLICIPGLGKLKAYKVLQNFGTIENIIKASRESLCSVVGNSQGTTLYTFFHSTQ